MRSRNLMNGAMMHSPKSNHSQITFTQLEARDEGLDMFSTVSRTRPRKDFDAFVILVAMSLNMFELPTPRKYTTHAYWLI